MVKFKHITVVTLLAVVLQVDVNVQAVNYVAFSCDTANVSTTQNNFFAAGHLVDLK